jgi:hypothetical protein
LRIEIEPRLSASFRVTHCSRVFARSVHLSRLHITLIFRRDETPAQRRMSNTSFRASVERRRHFT